jgi:four helix bundle suffix protein
LGLKGRTFINEELMAEEEGLIPKHGGYGNLKSFQIARLVYDLTVRFCDLYIDRKSRTHDQMVQAARSGVQNIAEGSQASGTSKKTELKLTNVARASLEELRLDYQDFLRQRGLPELEPEHPALKRFKARRCASLEEVREWVKEERHTDRHGPTRTDKDEEKGHTDGQGLARTDRDERQKECQSVAVSDSPCSFLSDSALIANAALSLLNLCCYFLDRQLAVQAASFEKEGGFTERLYRVRTKSRSHS